jgi:Zn-dependent protease with chaperone function
MLLFWGVLTALVIICAYVVALALAAGCAYIGYALLGSGSVGVGLLILAVGAITCAAAILWSLAPRPDKFTPPGPVLNAASQPRLFSEISTIAAEFEEPMPAAVYLMLDTNAWVAQRGGMLGWGSRRVMALGLPVLAVLTISEFRAVLAHEFAHYYGGDTGVGPWIAKARDALGRSLQNLSSNSGFLGIMSRWAYIAILRLIIVTIFGLYWKLFLRLTLMVSRQWEYRADELACAVAGAQPLVSGLRKIAGISLAWPAFWGSELVPSLQAGFRPPVADGFARFLLAPAIAQQVTANAAAIFQSEKPHIFSSHPTLQQRTERALSHRFNSASSVDAPAITLFDGAADLELSALQTLFPKAKLADLRSIEWQSIGPTIYLPSWRKFANEYRELLAPYRVGDIPDALANLGNFTAKVRDPKGTLLTREQRAQRCVALLWMAFALALLRDGWSLETQPGDFHLVRGERKLAPNDLVVRLKQGLLPEAEYRELVQTLGIAALPLAPAEQNTPEP